MLGADHRTLGERLLCENSFLHGLCRAVGVRLWWLMDFSVARFAALPAYLPVLPGVARREVIIGPLAVEADDMWSFMATKANQQWVWSAMGKQTRQIMAVHGGGITVTSARHSCGPKNRVQRELSPIVHTHTR